VQIQFQLSKKHSIIIFPTQKMRVAISGIQVSYKPGFSHSLKNWCFSKYLAIFLTKNTVSRNIFPSSLDPKQIKCHGAHDRQMEDWEWEVVGVGIASWNWSFTLLSGLIHSHTTLTWVPLGGNEGNFRMKWAI
jgi:hypothetical protein